MEKNIVPQIYQVKREDRQALNGHETMLIWFTGLSGSGKSTIANMVEYDLHKKGVSTYILDGDNVRSGLNRDLTFTAEDRSENIRRIAETAKLMLDAGLVVLAAFVSPYEQDRTNVRQIVGDQNFVEVYVNASVEECERRDVKGLYKKARQGEIKNLTGLSAPYEAPKSPEITIETEKVTIKEASGIVLDFVQSRLRIQK